MDDKKIILIKKLIGKYDFARAIPFTQLRKYGEKRMVLTVFNDRIRYELFKEIDKIQNDERNN